LLPPGLRHFLLTIALAVSGFNSAGTIRPNDPPIPAPSDGFGVALVAVTEKP